MAGASKQKQKLLIMEQLFRQRTDENHAITGNRLIDILGSMGIKAERKTIYDDIATLRDAGLDIRTTKIGHSNAYYLGERLFDDDELKILADSVASSRFLTIKKSNEMIKKLQTLTSEYRSPALRRAIHIENRSKSFNDAVYRTVDAVQEAIFSDREVEFTCADASGDRKKQGRRGEERIAVSPYQLVWEDERYFVICRCGKEGKICRISADKMTDIAVTEDKRHRLTEEEEREVRRLRSGGEDSEGRTEEIRLSFDKSLADAVCGRFGDRTAIKSADGDELYCDVTVQLSREFWGWLFALGEGARITAPESAAEEAGERLGRLAELYAR